MIVSKELNLNTKTPGLVVNEKVVSAGRIPSEAEITTFLVNALSGD
jgi:hypothetical protein